MSERCVGLARIESSCPNAAAAADSRRSRQARSATRESSPSGGKVSLRSGKQGADGWLAKVAGREGVSKEKAASQGSPRIQSRPASRRQRGASGDVQAGTLEEVPVRVRRNEAARKGSERRARRERGKGRKLDKGATCTNASVQVWHGARMVVDEGELADRERERVCVCVCLEDDVEADKQEARAPPASVLLSGTFHHCPRLAGRGISPPQLGLPGTYVRTYGLEIRRSAPTATTT
jgi:hypothetical protein